ncbi:MAG: hypothetical protein BAJATHORv1_40079 [Candidatus Thorarchaeota archaeon]|nr:MAG: hypothetical protein BAJATHORv1_40079 [Candidatus Thorarchaeota archaeon]
MAEEFLGRLTEIEKSIQGLGETLKRMVTILTTVTEVKTELRVAKSEIIDAISSITSIESTPAPPIESISPEDIKLIVKGELDELHSFIETSMESLKEEIFEEIQNMPAPVVAAPAAATSTGAPAPTPAGVSTPPDKAMKIADLLDNIIDSLKMGCVAGEVLDIMNETKAEIQKLVESDPITVKIDKWAGIISGYSKRHEVKARDVLAVKKELREEIKKYRP